MQENQLLDVLTREGVLINVSVRYWRATKKLNAEDLGLDPDKITDRLISLGHKKLLPKEALERLALVESRAHALIEASTFPFLKGLSRFLPNAKLQEVLDKVNGLARDFALAKADFLSRYAEMREEASAEWLAAARQLVSDPERLVATIEASFPSPAQMERFFEFSTQLFHIRLKGPCDIALQQQTNGTFGLSTDWWGGYVEQEVGPNYGRLLQLYAVHKAAREARKRGLTVQRTQRTDGSIKLTIGGL